MSASCCAVKERKTDYRSKITLYKPLIVILGISLVAAAALSLNGIPAMNGLMGTFLLFLSSLKLFNITAFAETFAKYDFIAKRSRGYALAYPFIELGLGCLYLSGGLPVLTNTIALFVMCVGNIGVAQVIRSKSKVTCACVGSGFNLPVGLVTLAENMVMAIMSAVNLSILHGIRI